MNLYVAGPLFSEAERAWLDTLAVRLRAEGFDCFVPHEHFAQAAEVTPAEIYRVDGDGLRGANALVAWLDGPMIDDGTAAEIGAFAELVRSGNPQYRGMVGIATDLRLQRRRGIAPGDGMNLFVIGALESCGRICWSTDEVVAALQELAGVRPTLAAATRTLTDVCMGRTPADLVITRGRLVNVHTRELQEVDIAIKDGRVAMFGDVAHTRGTSTETIDADGAYLVPGLVDTHLHVESAMLTVTRFAEAVLPHGTTTVFIDNHEMANVFGLEGVRWMLDEAERLPLKVFLAVPSCVPALPGFEDAGAVFGPEEIREALSWPGVGGLGEMMNMPGVLAADERVHGEIAATLERGLPVTGHWSLAGQRDHRLHAYAAAGVDSDHESVFREDALAKLRAGIWVQFRESSAWRNVAELVEVITHDGVDPRHCLLCTDDVQPETLVDTGHLNNAVRVAIEAGLDPLLAIQLATINAAEYFGLRHELGSIAPGRWADILFVEDLRAMVPHLVLAEGKPIGGDLPAYAYPAKAYDSVRIPALSRESFRIAADGSSARVRAIGMVSGVLATEHRVVEAPVADGEVFANAELDLAKAASIERHGGPGTIGLGFVQGLGLERGAVATTVAHDNHNLFVVGMNDDDMLFACELLREAGGGMIAVADGEVLGFVALPIAGLISDRPVGEVAADVGELAEAYRQLGSTIESPFMFVSLLSLGVIPALRLTNRGLVDGIEFTLVPPVVA